MKKVLIAVLVLATAVAIGAWFLLTNLNGIARKLIERAGTEAMGTPVTVGSVDISLSAGRAVVRDLKVANPPGYSSLPAVHFRALSAEVNARTRVIRRVYAGEPVFRVEMKGGRSNFELLGQRLKHRSSEPKSVTGPSSPAQEKDTTAQESGSSAVFEIRIFEIKDARLIMSDQQGHHDELVLSRLVLRNLHGTGRDIATQIFSRIVGRIAAYEARRAIEKQIRRTVEKHGGKGVRELLKGVGVN